MAGQRIRVRNNVKLRVAAFLSIIWPILLVAGFLLTFYGFVDDNKQFMKMGVLLLATSVFFFIYVFFSSHRLKCPVCMNPLISNKRCARNPKAEKLFGISYTYRVIVDSVFKKHTRCQYCGERLRIGE